MGSGYDISEPTIDLIWVKRDDGTVVPLASLPEEERKQMLQGNKDANDKTAWPL